MRNIVAALGVAACVPTVLAAGASWWWVFDLFTHFRVYYAGTLLVFSLAALWSRRRWLGGLCLIVCGINVAVIAPLYWPPAIEDHIGPRLRFMSMNVYTQNRQYEQVLGCIRAESPDVLFVMEVNRAWMEQLDCLRSDYPYFVAEPRSDNFGVAFFSKVPVEPLQIRSIGDSEIPSVVASLLLDQQTLTVIGTHPLPPVSSGYALERNRQLDAIADFVVSQSGPLVLLGDLNTTSWSPHFQSLVKKTGLRDSRIGFGIQPSWNGGRRFLAVPLDHVLVSESVYVQDRRIGPDVDSDHRPVIADVSVGRQNAD